MTLCYDGNGKEVGKGDDMATKIGINGFGRIGRQTLRAIKKYHPDELEVVAINSRADAATLARLLKYDSDYGHYDGTVQVENSNLIVSSYPLIKFYWVYEITVNFSFLHLSSCIFDFKNIISF